MITPVNECCHFTCTSLRRFRRGCGSLELITLLAFLSGWVMHEEQCRRREEKAAANLKQDFHAQVLWGPIFDRSEHAIDLREIVHGRFYIPVDRVTFHRSKVDDRAMEQLASFRYLDSLSFSQCHIERGAKFLPSRLPCLKRLDLYGHAR